MDAADPLREWRGQFFHPKVGGKKALYFCGNSLGLQPKTVKKYLLEELENWKMNGVEGHFVGARPWKPYHHFFKKQSARLVGALESEVVVMNTLTANLHSAMATFYRPTAERFKILMEAGAFPSDQYAVETQVKMHGFAPETAILEAAPRPGEDFLRTEDILDLIEKEGPTVALVLFGGVNYYTGQFFDLEKITKKGHSVGARVGFDLAHAAGNLPLKLHDWGPDFAVWCSYKYLNSGPGGPAGLFVHERHGQNFDLPRQGGWWGHDENERFQMKKGFKPMVGADGWQVSNAQVFASAPHLASLEIFDAVGMENLRAKSLQLTAFLEFLIGKRSGSGHRFRIITPKNPAERGCQLSVLTDERGRDLHRFLEKNAAISDWREPNVIRFAPVPLYNSFEDVWRLGQLLR